MGQLTSVVEANQRFAASFDKGELEIPPHPLGTSRS